MKAPKAKAPKKPTGDLPRSIAFPAEDLAALELVGRYARERLGVPEAATTQAELIRLAVRALIVRMTDEAPGTLAQELEAIAPGGRQRWGAYVRALGVAS